MSLISYARHRFLPAIIRERTRAGLASARARGRVGGNPGLKSRDPEAINRIHTGRRLAELERIEAPAYLWLPTVERLRPLQTWDAVTDEVIRVHPAGEWTKEKLIRSVKRLVRANKADERLLGTAPRLRTGRKQEPAIKTIGAFLTEAPSLTLDGLKVKLKYSAIRTPSGEKEWPTSTPARMVAKARREGLAPPKPAGRR